MESTPLSLTFSMFFFFNLILFFHPSYSLTISSFPIEANPTKSGYVTVNSSYGSTLFYVFYEAQKPIASIPNTPLLFWLEGGPGCSSMLANFNGVGPWRVRVDPLTQRLDLEPNEGAWNRRFGVVFLDNPVGTGFSVASSFVEVPKDQDNIAKSLYLAIKSFIDSDPSFQTRPIYLTGESYAGKYIPALAYYIGKKNRKGPDPINLVGFAVGNGWTDPLHQFKILAKNAYFMGLISEKQKWDLKDAVRPAVKMLLKKRWVDAADGRDSVLNMLRNMTGLATLFDVERKAPYEEPNLTEKLLQSSRVKKALGANPRTNFKECSDLVRQAMREDVMKSVRYMVEFVLTKKKYKVMFYEGQRDLEEGVVAAERWIRRMKWKWIDRFLMEDRRSWRVNGKLAGYVQSFRELTHVVVLGAGHYAAIDQPLNVQAMIEDWVLGRGFFLAKNELNDDHHHDYQQRGYATS